MSLRTEPRVGSPSIPGPCRFVERRGFTLLEVLVALSILVVLFGLLYGTLDSTQRLAEATEGESEIHRQAQIALSRMVWELSMLYWPAEAGPTQGLLVGLNEMRLGEDQKDWPADSVRFLSLSHVRLSKDAPEGERVEVAYLLDHDRLLRQSLFPEGGGSSEYPLAEGVIGLELRYFDGREGRWVEDWDSTRIGRPPHGVDIQLIFRDRSGRARLFRAMTDLPMGRGMG